MWIVSSRYARLSSSFSILLNLFLKDAATKLGLPKTAPKISSPSLLFLFTLLSIAFRYQNPHFFIPSSKLQPNLSINSKLCKVVGGYQQGCRHPNTNLCCTRFGNFDLISLLNGHRASENKSGPKKDPLVVLPIGYLNMCC